MRLYIDPGTGSMLFTILVGVLGAAIYSVRMLVIKLRYTVSGGKIKPNEKKIPFVIYSDDKRYWSIFKPVCRELGERGKEVVYLTASEDDPVFSCQYTNIKPECIGKGNVSFARLNFLNASVVLSTTPGLDVYQWKRSKEVDLYVHLPHAASDVTIYRMFGLDYYDSILLSGEYQAQDIRNLEKLRSLPPKELTIVGIPYMDEMAKRLSEAEPVPAHTRTVLLAPTWGPSGILCVYGKKIIDALVATGYRLIIRPHPQSAESEKDMLDELMKAYPGSESLEWNWDSDNFEVLRRSDIMISDFSGVIFDFSLIHDKPVIYTNPDFDVSIYDAWWLDTPLWTKTALPRMGELLKEEDLSRIKSLIDSCIDTPKYAEGRRQVKAETWMYAGEGAKRTADYLLEKYEQLKQKEK